MRCNQGQLDVLMSNVLIVEALVLALESTRIPHVLVKSYHGVDVEKPATVTPGWFGLF